METILIKPELLELVRRGLKITTCRKGIRNYPLGKAILKSNSSDDFSYISIIGISHLKFKHITDDIAKGDGFKSKESLFTVMRDIYGDITEESDISIISFKLEGD